MVGNATRLGASQLSATRRCASHHIATQRLSRWGSPAARARYRVGDLDHETRQVLDRTDAKNTGGTMSARLVSFDQKRTELTPGTILVRDWDRRSERVMVMADGFAWNGQTYDSLSKVAFAITGTKWNGPRFFGLRDGHNRDRRSTFSKFR
jgi:hypothetical protein